MTMSDKKRPPEAASGVLQYQQGELRVAEGECLFANPNEPPIDIHDLREHASALWPVVILTPRTLNIRRRLSTCPWNMRGVHIASRQVSLRKRRNDHARDKALRGNWRDGIQMVGNRRLSL